MEIVLWTDVDGALEVLEVLTLEVMLFTVVDEV